MTFLYILRRCAKADPDPTFFPGSGSRCESTVAHLQNVKTKDKFAK